MTWIGQTNGQEPTGTVPVSVVTPARHDGIGNALRSAFLPRASDIPRDLAELVERLR